MDETLQYPLNDTTFVVIEDLCECQGPSWEVAVDAFFGTVASPPEPAIETYPYLGGGYFV